MPTCLYCRETKPNDAFNREHVVPEAFGRFENNFVLNGVVCEACNTYFGRHLDIHLARDSIEGLDRYGQRVRQPNESTRLGGSPRLSARINDGGFHDGAEVRWGPSNDGRKLVLLPVPQLGISDNRGRQLWFRVEEFPARQDLGQHGFAAGTELSIKPFGVAFEEAERLLRERGYAINSFEILGGSDEGTETDIYISGTVDRVLTRALAKIAYNYLAYHYRRISMMEQFEEVRRYIRFDEIPSKPLVSLAPGDFLAGLPKEQVPVAHGVGVSWKAGQVIGQVTLFFGFHHRVVLADGGFLIEPSAVAKGHLFDPVNHQIVELTHDPKRGRPLPTSSDEKRDWE